DLGQPLAQPLVAHVATSSGTPASGVPVTFAVTSGGGALAPATVSTDASGNASTTFTVLSPGVTTVSATSASVAGAAAVFVVSTGPTIVGQVAIAPGSARFPALARRALPPPLILPSETPRPTRGLQVDVAYRASAVGAPAAGAIAALGLDRARV